MKARTGTRRREWCEEYDISCGVNIVVDVGKQTGKYSIEQVSSAINFVINDNTTRSESIS